MIHVIPVSRYDLPNMAAWLEAQAARGHKFTGFMGETYANFEKSAPAQCRYWLEACDDRAMSEEQKELYEAAGWELADLNFRRDFRVWRSARPDPTPIHTDPEVQALSCRRLERRLRNRALLYTVFGLACLLLLGTLPLWNIRNTVSEYYYLTQPLWTLFLLVFWTLWMWDDLSALRRLIASLKTGIPLERGKSRSPRRWAYWGMWAAMLLYFAAIVMAQSYDSHHDFLDFDGRLSDCPEPLPYVSMETLGVPEAGEKEYAVAWRGGLADAVYRIKDGKRYMRSRSGEGALITEVVYPGSTEFYRLKCAFLAGPLARELVRKELPVPAENLADSRFDGAWYAREDSGAQVIVLYRDGCVLWMRAEAPEDLREHLADFDAVFADFS